MSTEPQEVPADRPPVTEDVYPSLDLVAEMVPHSVSWMLHRYDAGQNRLQGLLIAIPVLTFGAIGLAMQTSKPELDALFCAAMLFFAMAMIVCVTSRTRGDVAVLNPMHLLENAWLSHAEYRTALVHAAGKAMEVNREAVRKKGIAVRTAAALLAVELVLLTFWWLT